MLLSNNNRKSSDPKANVISTGISLKDRLKLFDKNDSNSNFMKRNTVLLSNKITLTIMQKMII